MGFSRFDWIEISFRDKHDYKELSLAFEKAPSVPFVGWFCGEWLLAEEAQEGRPFAIVAGSAFSRKKITMLEWER